MTPKMYKYTKVIVVTIKYSCSLNTASRVTPKVLETGTSSWAFNLPKEIIFNNTQNHKLLFPIKNRNWKLEIGDDNSLQINIHIINMQKV